MRVLSSKATPYQALRIYKSNKNCHRRKSESDQLDTTNKMCELFTRPTLGGGSHLDHKNPQDLVVPNDWVHWSWLKQKSLPPHLLHPPGLHLPGCSPPLQLLLMRALSPRGGKPLQLWTPQWKRLLFPCFPVTSVTTQTLLKRGWGNTKGWSMENPRWMRSCHPLLCPPLRA